MQIAEWAIGLLVLVVFLCFGPRWIFGNSEDDE
jgi:hypothetical protein